MGNDQSKKDINELSKTTSYNKQELEELYKEFKALDKDNSGELDRNEFKTLFKTRMKGTTDDQMDRYFDQFDADKSGTISFKELATALSVMGKGTAQEKLQYLFELYDTDKDGSLTTKEIENILRQMKSVGSAMGRTGEKNETFIEAVVKKLDKDGNGTITKQEWITEGAKTPSLLLFLGIN